MSKLLSDNAEKISHILIASREVIDIGRIRSTIEAFDDDVAVSIVYPGTPEDHIPSKDEIKSKLVKRLLGRYSHLEQLVTEIPDGRDINYVPTPDKPWMWPQDLIHVQQDGFIIPSNYSTHPTSDTERQTQQDIGDLVSSSFWQENGFTMHPNTTTLGNTDGGDLIVSGNTVFVGTNIVYLHRYYDLNIHDVTMQKSNVALGLGEKGAYNRAKNSALRGLKTLDSERNFRVIDEAGIIQNHLDVYFTPIDRNTFVVGDINTTLEYLQIPPEIEPVPEYIGLAGKLDRLVQKLERHNKVVRVPLVPRMYAPDNDRAGSIRHEGKYSKSFKYIYPLMTFNNVLQERYSRNGQTTHIVYMPTFPVPEVVGVTGIDPSKFEHLQQQAIATYMSLGLQVRTVLFNNMEGYDGALRCSVKVLARG